MRPFSLGVTTLIQGVYTLMWLVVLVDVGSPTFNVQGSISWTGMHAVIAVVVLFVASAALGVVMHTVSRAVFHRVKQLWALEVLSSETVQHRFAPLRPVEVFPGGPKYDQILDEQTPDRVRKAGGFLHALEYQVMTRAPDVYRTIQVYRDQYRLARCFILPSAAFATILPFWDPVRALDVAGAIGPFPIIRTQLFLLSVLAAAVSYAAFRERSYRYAAAKVMAYATLEGEKANREGRAKG